MAELQTLLDQEIPASRRALLDSHNNLKKVAEYCTQKYLDESDKKAALEETKKFTTQSLASVAYQINTLASNMLNLLDIQTTQLASIDAAVNDIAHTVDNHKEKVARREIGLLTTSKVVSRGHQVIPPTTPDRPTKYVRKPIDFTQLDDIGHGVKLSTQSTKRKVSTRSIDTTSTTGVDGLSKRESIKSNTSSYGSLRIIKAPTVPQDITQNSLHLPTMFHSRSHSNSSAESGSISSSLGYRPGHGGVPESAEMPASPLPSPAKSPAAYAIPPPAPAVATNLPPPAPPIVPASSAVPPPPAPPLSMTSLGSPSPTLKLSSLDGDEETFPSVSDLPPPPPLNFFDNPNYEIHQPNLGYPIRVDPSGGGMPPISESDILPPPPPIGDEILVSPEGGSSSEGFRMEPDWVPKNYLEKMVVIYDYSADSADELSLREDQVVYVVKKNDDGWYEGVLDGVTGLFPGNYAEPVSS